MVKKSETSATTATAGGPTCTIVDGCNGEATLQGTLTCDSCGGESQNLRDNADKRRAGLAVLEQREDAVKTAARARDGQCGCADPSSHDGSTPESGGKPAPCPQPQSGDLTEVDHFELRVVAEQRRELGEQLERLEAAAGRVAREHTHPVFACAKHEKRLPS